MTDIAVRNDQHALDTGQGQDIARLAEWVRIADALYSLATKLVQTSFVPQQYRGKPHEATAAMLTGAEMGFGPMAALRAFDPIGGTPAPKAITLRAVAQSHGHEVRILHSDDQRAEVAVRRKGEQDWQNCVWTIERAQKAGYTKKNPNYATNAAAMLVARATAEGCRWVASDAIMGMPYAAEELQDNPELAPGPAPARKVTATEILGQPQAHDQRDPAQVRMDDARSDAWDDVDVAQPGSAAPEEAP